MNDFKTVYEAWSEDQLLESYKQRSGYQEEAVEALPYCSAKKREIIVIP